MAFPLNAVPRVPPLLHAAMDSAVSAGLCLGSGPPDDIFALRT